MTVVIKHEPDYPRWFITFTCFDWMPLFHLTPSCDLVYKWFDYLREKQIAEVISYVMMPNHLHLIMDLKTKEKTINQVVANGKRFMAYEMIERLKTKEQAEVLQELNAAVSDKDKLKGQKHRVFEPSFDAKPVFTDKFTWQKMNYIHHNPVRGKWSLVNDFTDYEHSSASFYELGVVKHFEPKHFRDE